MTKDELKELLEKGEELIIVDVREKLEYDGSGARFAYERKDDQGAVTATVAATNVPMGRLYSEAVMKGSYSKSSHIVAVCNNGERSRCIAKYLKDEKGYWMDYLDGGLDYWS